MTLQTAVIYGVLIGIHYVLKGLPLVREWLESMAPDLSSSEEWG